MKRQGTRRPIGRVPWSRGLVALGLAACMLWAAGPAAAAQPIVHAIFFYAMGCTNCDEVMQQFFPPLARAGS